MVLEGKSRRCNSCAQIREELFLTIENEYSHGWVVERLQDNWKMAGSRTRR